MHTNQIYSVIFARDAQTDIRTFCIGIFIEHCIIGETVFITPFILGAFYNNEINILFVDMKQADRQ